MITHDSIMGYSIYEKSSSALRSDLSAILSSNSSECTIVSCINPHSYIVAKYDPEFRNALTRADILIPDGIGIVYASKILGGRISNRLTGFDLFSELMAELNERGGRVFFLGSTEATLAKIERQVAIDYPRVIFSGSFSPPFKPSYDDADNIAIISAITKANPDVLWVGLTAPKQEKWLETNRAVLTVPVAGAIGAVFDFYAGNVRRSHFFFQKMGLEWLPRLLQEPKRLWRRMGVSAPLFVLDVFRFKVRKCLEDKAPDQNR